MVFDALTPVSLQQRVVLLSSEIPIPPEKIQKIERSPLVGANGVMLRSSTSQLPLPKVFQEDFVSASEVAADANGSDTNFLALMVRISERCVNTERLWAAGLRRTRGFSSLGAGAVMGETVLGWFMQAYQSPALPEVNRKLQFVLLKDQITGSKKVVIGLSGEIPGATGPNPPEFNDDNIVQAFGFAEVDFSVLPPELQEHFAQ